MDQKYWYQGICYKWEKSKAEIVYQTRNITIKDCAQAITDSNAMIIDQGSRWKYIGLSSIGLLTVIATNSETRIITAWHAFTTEIKEYTRIKHL